MKSSNTNVHKPIKVLIVVDSLAGGGAQELIYQLCSHLSQERIQFSVCALRSGGVYQKKIQALGVPVYVLSPTRNLVYFPLIIINLFRLLCSQQYDVVHTYLEGSFVIGTPLAYMAKIPSIHSIVALKAQSSQWYFPLMAWWQKLIGSYLLSAEPEELIKAGVKGNKIKLTESGSLIDLTEMFSVEHNPGQIIPPFELTDSYPVVLSVGRLHPDKGHEYVIRAWSDVLKEWPSARLLIVGAGNDERRLRNLVELFGLAGSVLVTGYRSDLATIFKRADIFVRASINEGVNVVTSQSMAAGLPVIGFKTERPKDFVIHGITGWLVGLRNESALSQAIIELSADRCLMEKLSQRARTGVRNYYDKTQIVAFYETIYGAAKKRHLNTLSDMRKVMWPNYNPFS